MKPSFLFLPLFCLASFSCDKVKDLANQARSAAEGQLAKNSSKTTEAQPDPELQALVDQTAEGVIFRKDLPLPAKFEVKITKVEEISGRFTQSSALGRQAVVLKGTTTTVTKLEREGEDLVRYALEQATLTVPPADGADDTKKPIVTQLVPPSKTRTFIKSDGVWKSGDGGDFGTAALAQLISPVFDQLLVDNTLALRPLWFGKKRLKIGDSITVTEQSLPMLVSGNAKGSLNLTLVAIEPVKGHPCGVFSVTGGYNQKRVPGFDGNVADLEITVQSGKLWLSLIYPLVLKEEADTVMSIRSGSQGNATMNGQGSNKLTLVREWKKTAP